MITPGPLTARAAAELNQALESLRALIESLGACVSAPLGVQRTGPRFQLRLGLDLPFPAKITGGSNPYSWKEVMPGTGGTFPDVPGGGTGTTNAYETGGKTDVPVNTVVQMYRGYPATDGQKYYFTPGGLPGTAGSGLTIREADGIPSGLITTLTVPNNSLSIVGSTGTLVDTDGTHDGFVNLIDQQLGFGTKTAQRVGVRSHTSPTPDAGTDPVLESKPFGSFQVLRFRRRSGGSSGDLDPLNLSFQCQTFWSSKLKWQSVDGSGNLENTWAEMGGERGNQGGTLLFSVWELGAGLGGGGLSFYFEPGLNPPRVTLGGHRNSVNPVYAISSNDGSVINNGVSGTFTSANGKTITVLGGIVVGIV